MELADVLSKKAIVFSLEGHNKKQVIRELLQALYRTGKITDVNQALNDVMARESHLSTGMENGLAVPHAKSDAVKELCVAFGLHHEGLEYESLDGKPVHFIFLVLSPRDTSGPHIQALARISYTLKEKRIRDELAKAKTTDEIHSILTAGHF